jgi:Leucine-rich repeat (LRR) protein
MHHEQLVVYSCATIILSVNHLRQPHALRKISRTADGLSFAATSLNCSNIGLEQLGEKTEHQHYYYYLFLGPLMIAHAPNLLFVNLSHNKLTNIEELSGLHRVMFVNLAWNKITNFNFSSSSVIWRQCQFLDLSHNNISSLPDDDLFSKTLPALRTLVLDNNKLQTLKWRVRMKKNLFSVVSVIILVLRFYQFDQIIYFLYLDSKIFRNLENCL